MNDNQTHWEKIYRSKNPNEMGWTQARPNTAIRILEELILDKGARIIDIGGGDSTFVDAALELGFTNIWVLDISKTALEKAKHRLGEKADLVNWVEADIKTFKTNMEFDFWYDRAVFHFITNDEEISEYVNTVSNSIKPGGYFLLGTFSPDGPEKCSGLFIRQYSESDMKSLFSDHFECLESFREDHLTPFDTVQNFQFACFQRKA